MKRTTYTVRWAVIGSKINTETKTFTNKRDAERWARLFAGIVITPDDTYIPKTFPSTR